VPHHHGFDALAVVQADQELGGGPGGGARRTLPATETMQPPLLKQKKNKANQLPNIATQSEMILRNGKEMSERSR
jgi:hypothetical protein